MVSRNSRKSVKTKTSGKTKKSVKAKKSANKRPKKSFKRSPAFRQQILIAIDAVKLEKGARIKPTFRQIAYKLSIKGNTSFDTTELKLYKFLKNPSNIDVASLLKNQGRK
jgi:YHS domain-containing protein